MSIIERIDKMTNLCENKGKQYFQKGAELNYKNGENWEQSDFTVENANIEDFADFKTKRSPRKYGLARNGYTVGTKPNGFQLRFKPEKIVLSNSKTSESIDLAYANTQSLINSGFIKDCFGPGIDMKLTNAQGAQSQTVVFSEKPIIINPYGNDACFEIWTEIEDSEQLKFRCHNMKYKNREFISGYWNKKDDCEVENFWLQQDTEFDKDLLFFENVELRPFIEEWRDFKRTVFDKDYGREVERTVCIAVTIQEPLYEKKRLVKRDGKIYLVESIPLWFLEEWDYSEKPLLLSYTTVAGALGSDTTWTAGTFYITGIVTLGAFNLTVDPDVIMKVNVSDLLALFVTGAGNLNINGTSALPCYMTSQNDDSVGETIIGSTGIPDPKDYRSGAAMASTGTAEFNYLITRYAGTNQTLAAYFWNANNAGKMTFNNCIMEQLGVASIARAAANTGARVEINDCIIRNCNEGGTDGWVDADEVYITNLQIYGTGANAQVMIRVYVPTDSYIRNVLIIGAWDSRPIFVDLIDAPNVIKITNVTIYGASRLADRQGIRLVDGTGTLSVKYSIVTGFDEGFSDSSSGVFLTDFNNIFGNNRNFDFITPGADDSQEDAMFYTNFDQDNLFPILLTTDSPGYGVTTPDKVDDADFEYLVGRTALADNTILTAGDNIPFGYCPKAVAGAGAPAVDIDVVLKKAGTRTVNFTLDDTIQATGSLESNLDVTGIDVLITVNRVSDDATIVTLFSGTTNLVANTPKTFAAIAGAALEWAGTPIGEYYIAVGVANGTPAVDITIDSQVTFVVSIPSVVDIVLPIELTIEEEEEIVLTIEEDIN